MKRNRAPLRLNVEESALLFITMIWGATFLIIRCALEETGPLFFVGIRFASAAFVVLALSLPVLRGFTRRELLAGAGIGVSIFAGYTLQTCGLQTITASKSAFITAFYVPLVPLLQWIVMRQAPGRMAWTGIALAFPGLILLSGPDGVSAGFGRGEILTALGGSGYCGGDYSYRSGCARSERAAHHAGAGDGGLSSELCSYARDGRAGSRIFLDRRMRRLRTGPGQRADPECDQLGAETRQPHPGHADLLL